MNTKPFFFQMAVKEVTQSDNGEVKIRGYASTPDLDRYRDIVEPEAFSKALSMFAKNPVLLRSHDQDRPIGSVDLTRVTEKGLWIEATVKEAQTASDVVAGLFKAFSIGYIPLKTELRNKDNKPLGIEDDPWDWNNIRVIKELDLVEISVVSTPANGNALFSLAKSLKDFGRKLALKAFETPGTGDVPENEAKAGEEVKSEDPVDEDTKEEETPSEEKAKKDGDVCMMPDGSEGHMMNGECVVNDQAKDADVENKDEAPVEDGKKDEDESQGESKDAPDDAENAGETPVADGGEGAKATEEPNADAKPTVEEDKSKEESEEKAVVLSKDFVASMPVLQELGLIRAAGDGEESEVLPKHVEALMVKLYTLLSSENKRANDQQTVAEGLLEKLNAIPERKVAAFHEHHKDVVVLPTGKEKSETEGKGRPSSSFMKLFTPNK